MIVLYSIRLDRIGILKEYTPTMQWHWEIEYDEGVLCTRIGGVRIPEKEFNERYLILGNL